MPTATGSGATRPCRPITPNKRPNQFPHLLSTPKRRRARNPPRRIYELQIFLILVHGSDPGAGADGPNKFGRPADDATNAGAVAPTSAPPRHALPDQWTFRLR